MKQVMLSLCDLTTVTAQPWADAGYLCYCIDLQHPAGETEVSENIITVGTDIMEWVPPFGNEVVFVASFPPCTDVAVSGARWFKQKGLTGLIQALRLVDRCRRIAEASGAPWFLENPVSTISSYWRKPDHTFDPYEYGGYKGGNDDAYTKKTCLWTGNDFVMPGKKPIELDPDTHDRIHKMPPGPERANLRSQTPKGFAQAVFEANCPEQKE